MDLVLKTFQKENFLSFARTFSIPIGIMILIAMMVIPLQPWMLDILFTSNLIGFFISFDGCFTNF